MKDLVAEYRLKKQEIRKRLSEFRSVWDANDRRIFSELCFCICTPQSNAVSCDRAVKDLVKKGFLCKGGSGSVRSCLRAVRFPNNKSRYIVEARGTFTKNGRMNIKDRIDTRSIKDTRVWLVRNVKGIGFKEASHFLRNIGFGEDIAILDVHILRNMKKYGVIEAIPKTISRKTYLALEDKLRDFSRKIKIPMDELDLLFWSKGTGRIFK